MELSRRSFFKRGLAFGASAAAAATASAETAHAEAPYKLRNVKGVINICCYCSGGCGTICSSRDGALIVSSRASYEMVQKAAMCSVEILFVVSAPPSLAVDMAQKYGMTLAAFCRNGGTERLHAPRPSYLASCGDVDSVTPLLRIYKGD